MRALMREMSDMEWLETVRKNVRGSATDITENRNKSSQL